MSLVSLQQNVKHGIKLTERKFFLIIDTDISGVTVNSLTIQENDFSGKILYTTPSNFRKIGESDSRPFGAVAYSPTLAFTFNTSDTISNCAIGIYSTSFPKPDHADPAKGQYIFPGFIEGGVYTLTIT